MSRPLSADLATAVAVSVPWAIVDVLRVGAPSLDVFAALLGSASFVLGVLVVSLRRAAIDGAALRVVVAGCALASLPLASFGAVVQRTTHHRALGGVTFAFIAAVVLLFAIAVAWRLSGVARGALYAAAVVSLAGTALLALRGLVSPASETLAPAVLDAAMGALALSAACAAVPLATRLPARVGAVAWLVVLAVGAVTIASQPSLCAALSARAPVAFALGAGCSG